MVRRFASLARFVVLWPVRVAQHRRTMAALGAMDDRGLADIGLRRQDLRDATALPRSADPTELFAARAREREARARAARQPLPRPPTRMAAE